MTSCRLCWWVAAVGGAGGQSPVRLVQIDWDEIVGWGELPGGESRLTAVSIASREREEGQNAKRRSRHYCHTAGLRLTTLPDITSSLFLSDQLISVEPDSGF